MINYLWNYIYKIIIYIKIRNYHYNFIILFIKIKNINNIINIINNKHCIIIFNDLITYIKMSDYMSILIVLHSLIRVRWEIIYVWIFLHRKLKLLLNNNQWLYKCEARLIVN